MKKNVKLGEYIFPMPALVIATYDKSGKEDAMVAAWGAIGDEKELFLCLSPMHKTVDNILENKCFSCSLATKKTMKQCDYIGLVSQKNDSDKMKKSLFHFQKSATINAPLIEELPFTLECTLESYDKKSGHLFAKIANIVADESVLDDKGHPILEKIDPISFDTFDHTYRSLGENIGQAFKIGKELE